MDETFGSRAPLEVQHVDQSLKALVVVGKRSNKRRGSFTGWWPNFSDISYTSCSTDPQRTEHLGEQHAKPIRSDHQTFSFQHPGSAWENDILVARCDQLVVQWDEELTTSNICERRSRFAACRNNPDLTVLHTELGYCGVGVVDVMLVQHTRSRLFQYTIVSVNDGSKTVSRRTEIRNDCDDGYSAVNSTAHLYIAYDKLLAVIDQREVQCVLYEMLDDYEDDDSARPDSTAALRTATLQVMTAYLLAHLAVYRVSCVDTLVADMVCFLGEERAVECCRQAPPGLLTRRRSSHFQMQTIKEALDSYKVVPQVAATTASTAHEEMGELTQEVTSPDVTQSGLLSLAAPAEAAVTTATVSTSTTTAAVVEKGGVPDIAADEMPMTIAQARPTAPKRKMFVQLLRPWSWFACRRSKVIPTQDRGAGEGKVARVRSESGRTAHTAHF